MSNNAKIVTGSTSSRTGLPNRIIGAYLKSEAQRKAEEKRIAVDRDRRGN